MLLDKDSGAERFDLARLVQPEQGTTALSQPLIDWMQQWLQNPPLEITLRSGTFTIND
jgi:hypothetical protein